MANEIEKRATSTEVSTPESNPYLAYAEVFSHSNIVGHLLKFSKGDWMFGKESTEVPDGTRFVANMENLFVGWVRWEDNRPMDQIMGLVCKAYQPPKRNTLGYLDREQWEIDSDGKPRDPWQFSNYLLLKDLEEGQLYTFTTSSKGGLSAVTELLRAFGTALPQRPGQFPIVALGGSSYPHPNRAFGKIKIPLLKIVGWQKKDKFGAITDTRDNDLEDDVAEESQDQIVEFPEPVKDKPAKGKPHGRI